MRMENQTMTWNFSEDSNATRSSCRTSVDLAFLTSYIVTGVAIFIGNLFTCAVFLSKHQLRSTYMNAFLISLACSDFLMAILVLPGFTLFCTNCLTLPFSLSRNSRTCRILDGFKDFVFLATVFNVLAITFDRYQAVLQSLRYHSRINKKTVTLILLLVWLVPWPIAFLKNILTFADPMILKKESSAFIYDNVVVFTCIISPMVVLLVVNTMLTRAIRGQQAKLSVPANLTRPQMEEIERKNEQENAVGETEKTRREKNGVRRGTEEGRCGNHVNEGFQGDDELDKNNGNNEQEINDHVNGESRDCHVTVPSINPTLAYTPTKATQESVINNSFQGNEEQKKNCSKLKNSEDHVTCDARDTHVTEYANDFRRKSLDISDGSEFDAEEIAIMEAKRSQTLSGFLQDFKIQQGCARRDDACEIQMTNVMASNTDDEESAKKSIKLEPLKSYPRRKIGCVVEPEKNKLELGNLEKTKESIEKSCAGNNEPNVDTRNITGTEQAKCSLQQEGLPCMKGKCINNTTQQLELEDAQATQSDQLKASTSSEKELQNEGSSSLENPAPGFLITATFSDSNANVFHQNGTFSNSKELKTQSQNKDNRMWDNTERTQDSETKNEERFNVVRNKSSTEPESPENKPGSRKSITFQEHKKPKANQTDSSLLSKQLRKVSRDRRERNGTRSCLTVALIFVVCWIPRCLYNVFLFFSATEVIDVYLLEKVSMLFLFMQSLTNPMVYCFYRSDFRQTAKELIRKIAKCGRAGY